MSASAYIQHHLQSLQYDLVNMQLGSNSGFWTINVDTMVVSWLLGLGFLLSFACAARRMRAGIPGRWQNCVEIMVEFVNAQVQQTLNEKDTFVSEFSLQAVKNLSSGANNDDATYAAARAGADADWSLFRAEAGAQTTFNNWTYGIKFEGQYADEPLISGEQFGAGGVHSVRGFRGREIAGDKGARLGLTITAPKLRSGLKFGWFFDAGTVERVSPLPDDSGKDSISGTGISLNWQWSRQIQMDAHFAHVLNAADQDVGSNTQEGDTFVHFNLSWFFQ